MAVEKILTKNSKTKENFYSAMSDTEEYQVDRRVQVPSVAVTVPTASLVRYFKPKVHLSPIRNKSNHSSTPRKSQKE